MNSSLDQPAAPVLEAIRRYHERGDINVTPPCHRGALAVERNPRRARRVPGVTP